MFDRIENGYLIGCASYVNRMRCVFPWLSGKDGLALFVLMCGLGARAGDTSWPVNRGSSKLVSVTSSGKLQYQPYDETGDVIPDFSMCGYGGGGVPIPKVPVRVTVIPQSGVSDDTRRLQVAVDHVANLTADKNGFRCAVLLKRGRYRFEGA